MHKTLALMAKEPPVANEEQLKRLKQGVKAWNEWRSNNPLAEINLSGADLNGAVLIGAVLNRANFREAYLIGADLSKADLSKADLSEAHLSGAVLNKANLSGAVLIVAHLSGAVLNRANLSGAYLAGADFSMANLNSADLNDADLSDADFWGADLSDADLSDANLSRLQGLGTNFTGANFTGACIEDWHINSGTKLDDVQCEYIYLKWDRQERRPSDPNRNFALGEFKALVQKALNTVDLIFRNGVDWQALLISLEKLRVEAAGAELSIQAIENKNDGAFVVRVNTPPEADKAEVEKFLKQEYEVTLRTLEAKYASQLQLQGEQLAFYREEMAAKRQENTQLMGVIQVMAENQAPKYDMRGSNFGNFADTVQDGGKQQAVQHIYAPEQDLAAAATEIQQLLAVVNPKSNEEFAEAVHREIQRNPTLKSRLVNALRSGGLEALKAIFNHPVFSIPAETVKGWLEAE